MGGLIAIVVSGLCELLMHDSLLRGLYLESIGRACVFAFTIYVIHRYAAASLRQYARKVKDSFLLLICLIFTVVLISFSRLICISLVSHETVRSALPGVGADSLFYAIPFATGGIVVQAVLGFQTAFIYSIITGLMVFLSFTGDPALVLLSITSTLVGSITLSKVRSRSAYLRAGLYMGLFSVVLALASLLMDSNLQLAEFIVRPGCSMLGGIIVAFLATGLTPIAEHVGGYVTDLRLIEMATLDHPLLKELSIRAPGTWNHSMVMGMMAESAASGIGANPVVARVGAYFHDIGKMTKPLYFVENQFGESNRHDKLSPSMSALIIKSHVKEGIELASQHKLPEVIVDMIPQHHGTSVIEYFYEKALTEAEEEGTEVERSLYAYPGPKPQTKEAGILMLADGIEAAARTISEPTIDRIQGLVQKMINKVFASGELDECELTLHDLHQIAKCFTRVLHSIHHQRIAYAEPAEKVAEKEEDPVSHESGSAVAEEDQVDVSGVEDLKRLGQDDFQ